MTNITRMGVDIGGTFTDVAAVDSDGLLQVGKVLTTPNREEEGVLAAIAASDVPIESVQVLVHGTTLVINALLERHGAKAALITTQGFRDIIELGRGNRPKDFDVFYHRDPPYVPRYLRYEVDERTQADGRVSRHPALEQLPDIVAALRAESVEAVAIAFINSYAAPDNEIAVKEELEQLFPEAFITCSSEISRSWREYERFTTAAGNAYTGPPIDRYFSAIERGLTTREFKGDLVVLDSNGGALSAVTARRFPIRMIESGPVGGVLGTLAIARELGLEDVVSFDMGGTTAKSALIEGGEHVSTEEYWPGGYETGLPVQAPSIDIVEVGAGGGSIAWLEGGQRLRIGPLSAGADPGPACYGRGGTEPTVTDANLYCGRIRPEFFLSSLHIHEEPARQAIEMLASRTGVDPGRLAAGILRLADVSMSDAVRRQTVARGRDPRKFTLFGFGGAGPLHACAVAAEVGIQRVLIPVAPGHFSAFGMLGANLRFDSREVYRTQLDKLVMSELEAKLHRIREGLTAVITSGSKIGAGLPLSFKFALSMRYRGQEHTLNIPAAADGLTPLSDFAGAMRAKFEEEHSLRFGHTQPFEVEVIEVSVTGERQLPKPDVARTSAEAPTGGKAEVRFGDDFVTTPFLPRAGLNLGDVVSGPAVIFEEGSNTVIPPGASARVIEGGHLEVTLPAS